MDMKQKCKNKMRKQTKLMKAQENIQKKLQKGVLKCANL